MGRVGRVAGSTRSAFGQGAYVMGHGFPKEGGKRLASSPGHMEAVFLWGTAEPLLLGHANICHPCPLLTGYCMESQIGYIQIHFPGKKQP